MPVIAGPCLTLSVAVCPWSPSLSFLFVRTPRTPPLCHCFVCRPPLPYPAAHQPSRANLCTPATRATVTRANAQIRVVLMIEDSHEAEQRRQMGIESDSGCSHDEIADAFREVRGEVGGEIRGERWGDREGKGWGLGERRGGAREEEGDRQVEAEGGRCVRDRTDRMLANRMPADRMPADRMPADRMVVRKLAPDMRNWLRPGVRGGRERGDKGVLSLPHPSSPLPSLTPLPTPLCPIPLPHSPLSPLSPPLSAPFLSPTPLPYSLSPTTSPPPVPPTSLPMLPRTSPPSPLPTASPSPVSPIPLPYASPLPSFPRLSPTPLSHPSPPPLSPTFLPPPPCLGQEEPAPEEAVGSGRHRTRPFPTLFLTPFQSLLSPLPPLPPPPHVPHGLLSSTPSPAPAAARRSQLLKRLPPFTLSCFSLRLPLLHPSRKHPLPLPLIIPPTAGWQGAIVEWNTQHEPPPLALQPSYTPDPPPPSEPALQHAMDYRQEEQQRRRASPRASLEEYEYKICIACMPNNCINSHVPHLIWGQS
ncbi:unnamed protein product [Closterium sp. Naga37s-1]|nr:unnamed protein product [Closterium sp. Naga37s-1]